MEQKPIQHIPWTITTCPLGAWLKVKARPLSGNSILTAKGETGVRDGSGIGLSYKELLELGEYSTDQGKTWKVCGTVIKPLNITSN